MEIINPLVTAAGPEYALDDNGGGEGETGMLRSVRAIVELGLRAAASDNDCGTNYDFAEHPVAVESLT